MSEGGYSSDEARKKLVQALMKLDQTYTNEDNVHYAEKAFLVNSIIDWGIKNRVNGKFSLQELKYYVTLVKGFIKGEYDLAWEDGKIIKNGSNIDGERSGSNSLV